MIRKSTPPPARRARKSRAPRREAANECRAIEADPLLKTVFQRIGKPLEAPFVPDPFQCRAVEAIRHTDCLVTAPTGSGKTWIAEQAIREVFLRGGRAWYTSPLKALTNSKWVEFGKIFGADHVGIVTGDTKENTDAPILVGTTEILRNQLYDAMHSGEDLGCELVILDEAHFLGDRDRGVVWEEIMIYLPARIHLLLLSATISNGEEIAAWLEKIRGKACAVVNETGRPVPLYPLFLHPRGRVMPLLAREKLYGPVREYLHRSHGGGHRPSRPDFGHILAVLKTFHLTPAIFFLKSRAECDAALKSCRIHAPDAASDPFPLVRDELLDRFPYLVNHKQRVHLDGARVAAHHGGQLPAWKFLVETLMKQGCLDAIFATSTVAAGVNFPARTIVLFNSDLFDGQAFSPMNGTEFHQMTGRAGRRGKDKIGFLLAIPGRFMDLTHVRDLLFKAAEPVHSRIRSDFSMVLNLLLSQTPEDIREIFASSFAAFQQKRGSRTGAVPAAGERSRDRRRTASPPMRTATADLWEDFLCHLAFLKAEGFVDTDDRLTESGVWASKLRLDQPLLIAECLRRGAFPREDAKLLAAVVAPFVYEGDEDPFPEKDRLPRRLVTACNRVARALQPFAARLEAAGFATHPLRFGAASILYDWARGADWDRIGDRTGIGEGDLAMLVLRTADNLRQIASLHETHPETAALAWNAREAILKEPVQFT